MLLSLSRVCLDNLIIVLRLGLYSMCLKCVVMVGDCVDVVLFVVCVVVYE